MSYATLSEKARKSFSYAILEEPDRFVEYAFKRNSKIKDFGDFQTAFTEEFDEGIGKNTRFDESDLIILWESNYCREKVRNNVDPEEFDRLYGDGNKVTYEPLPKQKVAIITAKKVSTKSYNKKGKVVLGYEKNTPKKYRDFEINFIKVQKKKGIKPSKIITNFNTHFSKNPRTSSSIRSKSYRV